MVFSALKVQKPIVQSFEIRTKSSEILQEIMTLVVGMTGEMIVYFKPLGLLMTTKKFNRRLNSNDASFDDVFRDAVSGDNDVRSTGRFL